MPRTASKFDTQRQGPQAGSDPRGIRELRGVPNGTRTRVAALKGRSPRPLDDGDALDERRKYCATDRCPPVAAGNPPHSSSVARQRYHEPIVRSGRQHSARASRSSGSRSARPGRAGRRVGAPVRLPPHRKPPSHRSYREVDPSLALPPCTWATPSGCHANRSIRLDFSRRPPIRRNGGLRVE